MVRVRLPDFESLIWSIFNNGATLPKDKAKNKKGLVCIKCNFLNEYMTEPNQDDGTYICYKCREF